MISPRTILMDLLRNNRPTPLLAAIKAKEAAEAHLKETILQTQLACTHEHLAEGPYQSSDYMGSSPPLRVCCDCGMTEVGWGPGYRVLTMIGDISVRAANRPVGITHLTRDEVYQLRLGLHIDRKHKGPLIRGEVTITDLLNGVQVKDDDD